MQLTVDQKLDMKILIKQFLGKNHSWSVCGWGIAKFLIKDGHEVHLFSTDGIENLPNDLKSNLIGYTEEQKPGTLYGKVPDQNYDCQISYTAMKNFPIYLQNGNKNRFGIWCYEWGGKNVLPTGFSKNYKYCDKILAPSQFAKKVFIDSGVPENFVDVVSHGISEEYCENTKIDLPTKKSFKILSNIAQNHKRKNIWGLLDAYGKAFSNKDDVCLILKAKDKPISMQFDVSLNDLIKKFKEKYSNHAEIKVMSNFIQDISSLYRSVDATFTMSHCEGFYFPGLESIVSGKMAIAPNWGGQLDFLNDYNSLLIDGKEERADPSSMYWESKNNAIWFKPSVDDAVEKLRLAKEKHNEINSLLENKRQNYYNEYSWQSIVKKILERTQ
jgi:glycosyltransferase involved in cell wall biosynthesis